MEFGWFNLSGLLIVALLLAPNIIYAVRHQGAEHRCIHPPMLVLEQLGRYGCIALMVLPLGVGKFGFYSMEAFLIWCVLCSVLLLAYFVCWALYFRKPSQASALSLAILPCALFILRGAFLHHWLLLAFGLMFAAGHIYCTWKTHKEAP